MRSSSPPVTASKDEKQPPCAALATRPTYPDARLDAPCRDAAHRQPHGSVLAPSIFKTYCALQEGIRVCEELQMQGELEGLLVNGDLDVGMRPKLNRS